MKTTLRTLVASVAALSFAASMSVSAFDDGDKAKADKEHAKMKEKWDKMTDEEKAAYKKKKAEMKAKWDKMTDEEKKAYKAKKKKHKKMKEDKKEKTEA